MSLVGIKNELSLLAERNLLSQPIEYLTNAESKERLVAHVLALLAQFTSAIRAGSYSSVSASRRQLLNIIAVIIGLGLDFVGVILRALVEVSMLFTLYSKESVDLCSILGLDAESIGQVSDPNTLLLLTYEELKLINSGQEIPKKNKTDKDYFLVDTILMQSKLRLTNDPGIKKLANSNKAGSSPRQVNFLQKDERLNVLNMPFFIEKKKKTLH